MHGWLVRGLGCVLLGGALCGLLCQHPTANAYVELGHAQMDRLEWRRALANFEQAIQIDPAEDEAWAGMAQIWHWQRYDVQARAAITRALKLSPRTAAYWVLAGAIDADVHAAASVSDWERALSSNPESAAANAAGEALAAYWLNLAQPEHVMPLCRRAPSGTAGLLRLCAIAALHLGQPAQAKTWCTHAGGECDDFAAIAGDWQGMPANQAHLGYAELVAGYARLAVESFDSALAASPNFGPWFAYRGWALWQIDQRDRAAQDFATAARLAPDDPGTTGGMALIDQGSGKTKEALILLQDWQQHHPPSAALWRLSADIAAGSGAIGIEEEALWNETLVAAPADRPGAMIALAQFYRDTGLGRDDGRAAWAVHMACQLTPNSAVAYDLVATWDLSQGHAEQALADLRRAIVLDPRFAPAHAHLGLLAYRLGALAQARIELERAEDLTIDPSLRQQIQPLLLSLGGA